MLRLARHVTGRPKVLVFNWCYHGTVDETFATLDGGAVVEREGNLGPPVPLDETTRVVEWNDVDALERELAHGDVACVLAEPALTNIGIVLPEPGFHDALRERTRAHGTLLVIDETHTLCAGPGGYTAAHGLEPDALTVGKAIGSGIPSAAYGFTRGARRRGSRRRSRPTTPTSAASAARSPATCSRSPRCGRRSRDVLTDDAFDADDRARRALRARRRADDRAPTTCRWHVTRLGCRVEYLFRRERPRNGQRGCGRTSTTCSTG